MNLQLFAQEKTEKATPRRRQKARERGQVFSSRELNSALILLTCFLLFRIIGKDLFRDILNFFDNTLTNYMNSQDLFSKKGIETFSYYILMFIGKLLAPIALTVVGISLFANYIQVGFVLSLEPISPKLERINPLEGLKRIFSKRSLLELVKSIIKIIIITYVAYTVIRNHIDIFPLMLDMDLTDSLRLIFTIAFEVGIKSAITLLILSIFDYFYQWYEYETGLMMSKQDIKEEYKEVEGNPQVKSRIRQLQRQMARSRMMADVKDADVVITNPTHYAVALAYDATIHSAPVIIAKGIDKIAEKIKDIANKEDVPIVEDKTLAQILYKTAEVGDIIPESLYNAVAEILALVYSLKERGF